MASAYRLIWLNTQTDRFDGCDGSGSKKKWWKFEINYTLDGATKSTVGLTGEDGSGMSSGAFTDWAEYGITQSDFTDEEWNEVLSLLKITISNKDDNYLNFRYYTQSGSGADACWKVETLTIDKLEGEEEATTPTDTPFGRAAGLTVDVEMVPGLTVAMETAVAEAAARAERAANAAEPGSALYISSMSRAIRLNRKTGLIAQDSFRLKWNDMRYPEAWSTEVTNEYNTIQNGEKPGTIALIRDNIYMPSGDVPKIWNLYYDLNTGAAQKSPRVLNPYTDVDGLLFSAPGFFLITYGTVEKDALETKYKRFEGTYDRGMELAIDDLVNRAISQLRTKSKYNFKKVDTNKRFRKKNLSLFSEQRRPTETMGISATTTTSTAPMGPSRGSSY